MALDSHVMRKTFVDCVSTFSCKHSCLHDKQIFCISLGKQTIEDINEMKSGNDLGVRNVSP